MHRLVVVVAAAEEAEQIAEDRNGYFELRTEIERKTLTISGRT